VFHRRYLSRSEFLKHLAVNNLDGLDQGTIFQLLLLPSIFHSSTNKSFPLWKSTDT
jgi:hypothetical protein